MNAVRRFLLSVLLVLSFVLLIQLHRMNTLVPLDPYWRYQGDMLATHIFQSGSLPSGTEFDDHSLLTGWVNSFYDDFGSPLIVAILSLVTGIETLSLETLPLYAPALILVQSALATALVGDRDLFPVALASAVLYKFLAPHTFANAHRGGLSWTILLFLILSLVISKQGQRRSTYLVLIFGMLLPATAHTLPVAALLFVASLLLLSELFNRPLLRFGRAAILGIVIVAYNLIVSTWIGRVVFKFTVAMSSVSEPLTLSMIIESIARSAAVHQSLLPYLTDGAPPVFRALVIVSVLMAALVTVSVVLYRTAKIYTSGFSTDEIQTLDIIIVAFGVQALAYVSIIPFFAPSGGINPPLLGLMFFPIVATKFVQILRAWGPFAGTWSDAAMVSIILLILLPGAVASFINPMTVGEINSFSQDEYHTLEWVETHNSARIVTDFETASSYYAIGGRSPTYLPPPGEPAYSDAENAKRVIRLYYTDPGNACDHGDLYVVPERSIDRGIIHLGSLVTLPTSDIERTASTSPALHRVYSTDDSFISACG